MSNPQAPRDEGRAPVERRPRQRSAFAAAFLSLLFPGLGHAYAGASPRALAFAAAAAADRRAARRGRPARGPRGPARRSSPRSGPARRCSACNLVLLIYRVVAAVDAWNVARFLNEADRRGSRPPPAGVQEDARHRAAQLVSVGGLLAVLLVMAGAHAAVAQLQRPRPQTSSSACSPRRGTPRCETADESPSPGASGEPTASRVASRDRGARRQSDERRPDAPRARAATGTPLPTLPPWDGKERLNVLLVGSDARPGESSFNTDTLIVVSVEPETERGRDVPGAARHGRRAGAGERAQRLGHRVPRQDQQLVHRRTATAPTCGPARPPTRAASTRSRRCSASSTASTSGTTRWSTSRASEGRQHDGRRATSTSRSPSTRASTRRRGGA